MPSFAGAGSRGSRTGRDGKAKTEQEIQRNMAGISERSGSVPFRYDAPVAMPPCRWIAKGNLLRSVQP